MSDVNLGAEVMCVTHKRMRETNVSRIDWTNVSRIDTRGAQVVVELSLSALTLCPDLEFRLLVSGENRHGRRRSRRHCLSDKRERNVGENLKQSKNLKQSYPV